ncbi:MAG TPA: O-antigen ligase family protein [Devosiaceae bacterium]
MSRYSEGMAQAPHRATILPARREVIEANIIAGTLLGISLVLSFVAGKATNALFALIIVSAFRPSTTKAFRARTRNPINLLFFFGFAGMVLAYALTARSLHDFSYVLNFAPLPLCLLLMWRLEKASFGNGMLLIAWLALIGTAMAVASGAFQVFVLGVERAGAAGFNPIYMGDTAILCGALALAGLLVPGVPHRSRLPLLLAPFLAIVAVVLTGSRGALLAIPAFAAIGTGFAYAHARRKWLVLAAAATGVALMVAVFLVAMATGATRITQMISVMHEALVHWHSDDFDTQVRLDFYLAGIKAFLASPLIGHGWPGMMGAVAEFMPPDTARYAAIYRHLHNDIINFAASAGIVGLASYAAFISAPVVGVLALPRDRQFPARLYAACVLVAGNLIFGLTNVVIGYSFPTDLFAALTICIVTVGREPQQGFQAMSRLDEFRTGGPGY